MRQISDKNRMHGERKSVEGRQMDDVMKNEYILRRWSWGMEEGELVNSGMKSSNREGSMLTPLQNMSEEQIKKRETRGSKNH